MPYDSFDKSASNYGHKYYFYLMEAIGKEGTMGEDKRPKLVDEFLIIFDELVRVAKDYGLTLVMKKNIGQYYDDMCSDQPISQ